jgi:thioredoxin-related protein
MRKSSKIIGLTVLSFTLLLNTSIFAYGNNEKTEWLKDYNLALRTAKKEGKPILAYFSGSDWCRPCMQLQQEVFDSDSFAEFADKHFVLVQFDFPMRSENKLSEIQVKHNEEIAEKLNSEGLFPAIVIVDENEKVLGIISGYNRIGIEAYLEKLNSFVDIN